LLGPDAPQKPLSLRGSFVIQVIVKASEFFALPASLARFARFFPADAAPWTWLTQIGAALEAAEFGPSELTIPPGVHIEGRVWLHPSVKLPAHATIIGPAYIGAKTEIRPGAFIRGNVIVGEGCVLGNSSEFKNALLMDKVQVPHFNYVGDSILGNGSHLGAGVICSNLRLDQGQVIVRLPTGPVPTGLRKFGAVLGDKAEVGCNAVLNPGTLLGPRALVMPCTAFGGYLPANTIARSQQAVTLVPRPD
jgi:NDP-sugar pyrophosphorylase family protein